MDAQALYARLFSSRRGGWLRVSSLVNYHEAFGPIYFDVLEDEGNGGDDDADADNSAANISGHAEDMEEYVSTTRESQNKETHYMT